MDGAFLTFRYRTFQDALNLVTFSLSQKILCKTSDNMNEGSTAVLLPLVLTGEICVDICVPCQSAKPTAKGSFGLIPT